MLGRAVAGYAEVDVHPYQVALSRAALARALWGAGAIATALVPSPAKRSRRWPATAGWASEREEVQRWLAERAAAD
ncbi:hypothetical protein [Nannocystis radixulma]|uniref:Uncharacterized protein n=1 Tax=Nannocystis radixulma TaxID=2995305 RepID=A0ABT5BHW0_9BACT|nr:hypothetical protein [Nannocystis radixulma]MDC0673744.1 hypothetical protein [Nannocystis radixulma]